MPNLHFFSIGDNINSTGRYGFVQNSINAAKIEDGLMDSGDILNKMGTSIPTPYARLYLFDSAFKQINTYHSDLKLQKVAHDGIYDNGGQVVPTAYHHLVSECLDLLEFIFKYGDQKNFDVIEWDVESECKLLEANGSAEQRELAESLFDSYKDTVLGSFSKIYIFTWDGIIIGGTSPITLVYTSPNVRRLLKEKGIEDHFKGEQGNVLFNKSVATPLYKRSENFRNFIYTYWLLELSKVATIKKMDFFTYIKNSQAVYDKAITINKKNPSLDNVKPLEASAGIIKTANVNLYCSHNVFDPTQCDYILTPTVGIYETEVIGGQNMKVLTPAVLTPNGLDGKRYAPRCWNRASDSIPPVLEKYLTQRELPGTTYKYPYLTVDDFLAEKLIEVSYVIRKDMFYTGTESDSKYLLPLKKEFFKFFTINDIDSIVIVTEDKETENITVDMNVPISGGHIKLTKTYTSKDKIDCYDAMHTFNLAIFPSYRTPPVNGVNNNVYNVMLGSTIPSLKLDFYKVLDLSKAYNQQQIGNIQDVLRTKEEADGFETRHINVPSDFDILELAVEDKAGIYTGIILPKFKTIPGVVNKFTFCVDFGTTNTHVAYVKTAVANNSVVTPNMIRSFDISKNDVCNDTQVMLLSDDKGFGFFLKFKTFLQREFVPLELGESGGICYPMRTTSWEINRNVATLDMFKSVNIGFNYDKELAVNSNLAGQYKTNIKWARRGDIVAQARMREYFKQLLWMMKSKSVLGNGGADFNVVATYPQSMSVPEASALKNAWRNAQQQVKAQVNLKFEFESVAPYYSFLNGLKYGQPYMNLDIGGGTTDILHVRPIPGKTDQTAVFSAIFAANDIWGDGCNDANNPKENGFVAYYLQSNEFAALSDTKKLALRSVCENASSSSDIMSYLFSHDNDRDDPAQISQAIQGSCEMMTIPIVHFSSLMYYIAFVLDLAELKIPTTITFTGMGSKYIKLIGSDEEALGRLISKIFTYYGKLVDNKELVNANIKVLFALEPKLVTASGGLIMNSRSHAQRLIPDNCLCHAYNEEEYGCPVFGRDIQTLKPVVLKEFQQFAKMFSNQEFITALSRLGHTLSIDLHNELIEFAESSFELMLNQNSDPNLNNSLIENPVFFWSLKETLYQLSKTCASRAINPN